MAEEGFSPPSPQPPPSPLSVFVDTNLDTHLAMVLSPDATVADLKGKIRIEHAICFPDIGEISVQAMKVRRRTSFYHLSDSMPVKSAFDGIKGTWFLHLDLVPTTPMVKNLAETARIIMTESGGQPEKQIALQTQHDAIVLHGVDRDQEYVMNGLPTENSLIQTSLLNVHKSQTLSDTLQFQQDHDVSLLPGEDGDQEFARNGMSNEKRLIQISTSNVQESETLPDALTFQTDHDASLLPAEERDQEVSKNGLSTEKAFVHTSISNAHEIEMLADTLLQKPSAQDSSLLPNVSIPQTQNSVASSDDKFVSGVKSIDGSTLLTKSQHDLNSNSGVCPLELDKRPDPSVSAVELVIEDDEADGSNHHQKSGHVDNPGNKDGEGGDQRNVGVRADVDVPVVTSKKEKSRKRSSALQHDQLQSSKSEHEKKRRKKDKCHSFKETAKEQLTGNNYGSDDHNKQKSQLEKVLPENSFQGKHETNLVSSEGFPRKPPHADSSLQQAAIDDNQKKRKRMHVSKSDEAPRDGSVDNSLNKIDTSLASEVNHIDGLNSHTSLGKEPDAADLFETSTLKVFDGSSSELNMADPLSTNFKDSNYSTVRLLKCTTTSADFPMQEVRNDYPECPLHNNYTALKESNSSDICKEAEQPNCQAEVDLEVPAKSHRSRKKAKTEKDSSSKHDVSSVKPLDEENIDKAPGNNCGKLYKASGKAMTHTDLGNKDATKSTIPSEIVVKSSENRRKKQRGKPELPSIQSNAQETVNSSRDQGPEENQNKTPSDHQEHPGKEFEGAAVPGNAAVTGNSTAVESAVLSIPSDRKQKRGHKKSKKIELHQKVSKLQSGTHETVNSSIDQAMEEFSKETSSIHLDHPGKEPKEATFLGQAAENSTVAQPIVSSKHNDRKPKRNQKKSEKIDHPESACPLGEEVIKENPKESTEDNQNEASGSHLGHPGEEVQGAAVIGEAAVIAHLVRVDPAVPLSPSNNKSKRSKKKSGKIGLPRKESSIDETIHPLVKEATKESSVGTFNAVPPI